jgi:general secretion pathway protein B
MSYILDALKKIEHEKKAQHPDGRVNISGDLFKERKQVPAKSAAWKIAALIVAASLVTCAGTWLALRGSGTKRAAVIRPVAPPPPAPVVAPASVPVPVAVQPPPAVPVAAPPVASTPVAPVVPKRPQQAKAQRGSVRQSVQTVQTVPPPADIKLSGIAWQDERAARRAVVNGFLLKEGAVVSGAKITDIQADRVRFSSPAGVFDLKLDSVVPEVKK